MKTEWETPGTDGNARVICVRDPKGKRRTLAHVYCLPHDKDETARDARARLIAGAPDLLAACELAYQYVAATDADTLKAELAAVIAKAKGGAS